MGKKRIEIDIEDLKKNKTLLGKYMIQDVGSKTIKYFKHFIDISGSIYLKGPSGNFEDKFFEEGSRELINYVSKSDAFYLYGWRT